MRILLPLLVVATPALAKPLTVEVFTADPAGFHVTSTLVKGEKEAVLIDAQFTRAAAHRLAAQILDSGKELKAIFVTHSHPDHYFGADVLLQAFPEAKLYAPAEVVEQAKVMGPQKLAAWKPMYGKNLTDAPATPEAYDKDSYVLEGEEIKIIKLKPGEIENSYVYHIPGAKTVVTGDAVYNDVHVWLAETDAARRQTWLENLKTIRALGAKTIVAGHKKPNGKDTAKAIDFTEGYIKEFEKQNAKTKTPEALEKAVAAKYKQAALPVILGFAAKAAKAPAAPAAAPAPTATPAAEPAPAPAAAEPAPEAIPQTEPPS